MLKSGMNKPVDFMQDMAAKVKKYVDYRMANELNEFNYISEYTRKWVSTYNDLLEQIQKALYGTKSMSINLHKISHSDMAAAMRKHREIRENEEVVMEIDEV